MLDFSKWLCTRIWRKLTLLESKRNWFNRMQKHLYLQFWCRFSVLWSHRLTEWQSLIGDKKEHYFNALHRHIGLSASRASCTTKEILGIPSFLPTSVSYPMQLWTLAWPKDTAHIQSLCHGGCHCCLFRNKKTSPVPCQCQGCACYRGIYIHSNMSVFGTRIKKVGLPCHTTDTSDRLFSSRWFRLVIGRSVDKALSAHWLLLEIHYEHPCVDTSSDF